MKGQRFLAGTSTRRPLTRDRGSGIANRLNWLRAGVMGANDGIVSTASMVVGVASAAVSDFALLVAGVAAVVAGALSMAVSEYVAVSSQRDTQRSALATERKELAGDPADELEELARLIRDQGIDRDLAHEVAVQLTARDALGAHARIELGFDPRELNNPWQAAFACMASFLAGGAIPLVAILLSPRAVAVQVTVIAVVIALAITGSVAAELGHAPRLRAVLRVTGGGIVAMAITYGIGSVVGA